VFTLRCTARLVRRLKVDPASVTPDPTGPLADWHANLLHVGRQQLVLAVSDKTLLPVLVAAAPGATLVPRLRVALRDVLAALGVPREVIDHQIDAMADATYAKASNRQILGILVDFAKALPFYLDRHGTLLAASLVLAETPCGPLFKTPHCSPHATTQALLGARRLRLVN
jgi:hypothetical protein